MKTTAEKIAVMQAYEDGRGIEYKPHNGAVWMALAVAPSWDWVSNDYRVAETKPDFIDWSQVPDDYRFMARNENGTAALFKSKPDLYPFGWSAMVEGETEFEKYTFAVSAHAHTSYKNNGIDWRESLVERPKSIESDSPDWGVIPERFKFFARDKCGLSFIFPEKPYIRTDCEWWHPACSHVNVTNYDKNFRAGSTPWDKSLIERPATQ